MLDEVDDVDAGTIGDAPTPSALGFYTSFDMSKDHTSAWYRSPGQPQGTAGDPYRDEDPAMQIGMKADAGGSPLAPQIWQLTAGSDTSNVLGANAKPSSDNVGSEDGSEEEVEAPGSETDAEEAEREGQVTGSAERGRQRQHV